jgi:predicted O-methyltransferase YrrM
MDHIYQNQNFEEDWFTYPKLYSKMVNRFPSGSVFVEIGSWKGKSSAFMAVEIINSDKDIEFFCVDTWKGSEEHSDYQKDRLFEKFLKNIEPVSYYIKPLRMTSLQAANIFKDQSVDFCFIDAAHDYENVKNDILAWLPKVKSGGTIGGHDYHANGQYWPGVTKAVHECIPRNKLQNEGDWWWYDVQRN